MLHISCLCLCLHINWSLPPYSNIPVYFGNVLTGRGCIKNGRTSPQSELICFFFFSNILYPADPSGCTVSLRVTDTKQYIATEGYPYHYKNNQRCRFSFRAPAGRRIVIVFEGVDLQLPSSNRYLDYLHFRKFRTTKLGCPRFWSENHLIELINQEKFKQKTFWDFKPCPPPPIYWYTVR